MTIRERTIAARIAESRRGNSTHKIAKARVGANRHSPGFYLCSCGESFTRFNDFEGHRADAKRRA